MNRKNIRTFAFILAALTSGVVFGAHPPSIILEHGIETSSSLLTLPSNQTGVLGVRECETCEITTWRMSADTKLYVGSKQVTLEQLSDYVRNQREAKYVTVAYRVSDQIVSRIAVSLQ